MSDAVIVLMGEWSRHFGFLLDYTLQQVYLLEWRGHKQKWRCANEDSVLCLMVVGNSCKALGMVVQNLRQLEGRRKVRIKSSSESITSKIDYIKKILWQQFGANAHPKDGNSKKENARKKLKFCILFERQEAAALEEAPLACVVCSEIAWERILNWGVRNGGRD